MLMASWLYGIAVACTQYVSTHAGVYSEEIHCSRSDTHNSTSQSVDLVSLATGKYIIVSCCSRWLLSL